MTAIAPFKTHINLELVDMATDVDLSKPPDFSINVDGEIIPVHIDLLRVTAPYFQCLFESNMLEVQTATMEVKDINASVVNTVIAYIYGMDISIEWDNVIDYVDIVEMWQMAELKDKLEGYIVRNINTHDCKEWVLVAQKYHLHLLQLFLSNFTVESVSGSFLSLDIAALKNVLTKNCVAEIGFISTIHEACMNWILKDEALRQCHYPELLKCVGLSECSPRFIEIMLNIYKHRSFWGTTSLNVMSYTSLIAATESKLAPQVAGDFLFSMNKGIYCFNFTEEPGKVEKIGYFPVVSTDKLHWSSYCKTSHGIFICMEYHRELPEKMNPGRSAQTNKTSHLQTFHFVILDVPSGKPVFLPDMLERAMNIASVFVDGKVYVFLQQRYPHVKMIYLDLKTMTWLKCTSQPPFMHNVPKLHSIETTIYALDFCGRSASNHVYAFYCFNTILETWCKLNCLPTCCTSCRLITVTADTDILFYRGDGLLFKYGTKTDSWTTVTAIQGDCAKMFVPVCHCQGRILFCRDMYEWIDMYDMRFDRWYPDVVKKPSGMVMYPYMASHGQMR